MITLKLSRKDKDFLIGKKKSLKVSLYNDLSNLCAVSQKNFIIEDICSSEWSVTYITDRMSDKSQALEFIFKSECGDRTLQPLRINMWENDAISDVWKMEAEIC